MCSFLFLKRFRLLCVTKVPQEIHFACRRVSYVPPVSAGFTKILKHRERAKKMRNTTTLVKCPSLEPPLRVAPYINVHADVSNKTGEQTDFFFGICVYVHRGRRGKGESTWRKTPLRAKRDAAPRLSSAPTWKKKTIGHHKR